MPEGTIPAPGRIEINNVLAFAEGDPVPEEQAKQLFKDGNWPGPNPAPRKRVVKKTAKRARKATEDRAVKGPREDRAK